MNEQNRKNNETHTAAKREKLQYGTTTIILVAIVTVLVIALNVFVGMLRNQVPVDIDLTHSKIYTISDTALKYAQSLKDEITFYVLNNERDFAASYSQPLAIVNEFMKANKNFKIEYIDPQVNNTFATKYPFDELQENDIIVQKGNRHKLISNTLFIETSSDSTTGLETVTSQIEDRLVSALYDVLESTTYTVGFTNGHGEAQSNVFRENIQENNFKVKDVSLDEAGWSDGINILIIYAPLNDFSVDNVKELDKFMDNNGKQDRYIAYFAAPDQPDMPNLAEFLKDWGIEVTNNIIVEADSSRMKQGERFNIFAQINDAQSRYGSDYINLRPGSGYQLFLPLCRELKTTFDSKDGVTTQTVALANGKASVVPTDNVYAKGEEGDFVGIIDASRSMNGTISRLLVSGSSGMVSDGVLSLGEPTINQKFIIKALNSWTDKVQSEVIVQPADITTPSIQLTTRTANFWLTIFVVLIPAGILVAGMLVFIKRRYQ